MTRLDDSVGRIVHALGNRGMLRNSLILFLTDNGAAPIGKSRNYGSNYPLRGVSVPQIGREGCTSDSHFSSLSVCVNDGRRVQVDPLRVIHRSFGIVEPVT